MTRLLRVRRSRLRGGPSLLSRAARGAAITAAALVPLALGAQQAVAADLSSGQEITRYEVTAQVRADGSTTVALDFDFDFGDTPGRGPYLTVPTRQGIDSETERLFSVSDVGAASPSGAPATVNLSEEGDALVIRVGDRDRDDISGVQRYQVSYTVTGLTNLDATTGDGDQLYWNVIGAGWEIPLSGISVEISGPQAVTRVACYAGTSSTRSCTSAAVSDGAALFTQDQLLSGQQLTVVAQWPAGTIPGGGAIIGEITNPVDVSFAAHPLSIAAAVAVAGGAGGALIYRVRSRGRDKAYLGVTPGLTPAGGQDEAQGYRDKRAPVAVQFQPPAGVRPGELGTLLDEVADPRDVTATVIDFAVRGYLRIEEVPRRNPKKKPKDWTLVALRSPQGEFTAWELSLWEGIFGHGSEPAPVALSSLRQKFAATMAVVQAGLYTTVVSNGWFRSNPRSVRITWMLVGGAIALLGFGAFVANLATGKVPGGAWLALAVGGVGLLAMALAKAAPARTAAGTAVLAQAVGFQQYLTTAEGPQLRWEEGEDLFSRYLPYAIVFGVAERWAGVFAALAAQGYHLAIPTWYVAASIDPSGFWGASTGFARNIGSFAAVSSQALSAPAASSGSSGGSGFSGGFSGGGVGGGGGGGW